MALKALLIFCLHACIYQTVLSQCAASYGPQLGINSGPGQIGSLGGIGPLNGPINNPTLGPIGPAGPAYGYGNPSSYNPTGNYGSSYPGYGGSGSGDVAVAGELPVIGSTLVAGQVPVVGGVQFGGSIPAAGLVTITGTCSCGSPYGY